MNLNRFSNTFYLLLLSTLLTATVQAASVSYYIDQSNALPDGVNYAQVTISDSNTNIGDIDFLVEIIPSAFSVSPDANFGMQTFSFNYDTTLSNSDMNITNIDPSWSISANNNAGGGFGKFGFELSGTGSTRTDVLSFSISGITGDTPMSYATGSELNPSSGEFFATHIAGFDLTEGVTSAQFAGSSPVPVPAAAWLFASGLLGLVGYARRRQS